MAAGGGSEKTPNDVEFINKQPALRVSFCVGKVCVTVRNRQETCGTIALALLSFARAKHSGRYVKVCDVIASIGSFSAQQSIRKCLSLWPDPEHHEFELQYDHKFRSISLVLLPDTVLVRIE